MANLREPFFTDVDYRAQVKGSRDPIGAQGIWTSFGRKVVGNVTTVSTSIRDFTVLLMGYYLAEQVANEVGEASELETFLKWEQLAAFVRAHVNRDFSFRGTERVQRALSEGTRFTTSASGASQILSDQPTYGIWGLYSMPAMESGLVKREPPRLTDDGLLFVEKYYLPRFHKAGGNVERLVSLLAKREASFDLARDTNGGLFNAVAALLKRELTRQERDFYWSYIAEGGPKDNTKGCQPLLARLLSERLPQKDVTWTPALVRDLAKAARKHDGGTLSDELERICTCESVLAPAALLFAFIQGLSGVTLNAAIKRIKDCWGARVKTIDLARFEELRPQLSKVRAETAENWIRIAAGLSAGRYEDVVERLIEQNKATMELRGGAAWIELRGGAFHVRLRDEQGDLPPADGLPDLWRFSYFINSLQLITNALGGPNDE
jgi:hypothetical protein